MLGAVLALASAAFFGLNNAAVRRGVVGATVLQGLAITVPFGVPFFMIVAAFMGGFRAMADWGLSPWLWMASAGVVHFVIGRYGNYMATVKLGSTLSTPIQQLSVLIALMLAFAFLGETLNWVNLAGILLVMLGPAVLLGRKKAVARAAKSKDFDPQYASGMFWGAVSAFGYGLSPMLVALGIGEGGLADSAGGLLVSYGAATLVTLGWIAALGGRRYLGALESRSAMWFLLSALFVALSQLFRYAALAVAPISVVVPIQRLSVVFRLIFNALLNRQIEVFDRWVVFSILLSVLGAVALAGDTDMLLGWAGLDEAQWLARPLF